MSSFTRPDHIRYTAQIANVRRDAPLLGGTVFDLLAREEGDAACVKLARSPLSEGPEAALEAAFHGRALRHTEDAWRAHLERLSEPGATFTRAPRRPRRSPRTPPR